ncbi:unnamed protein product, partial [Mesorhabditis belari]|uniref:dDENN domain-containing protein n=1 Tax=Mesorhabditis belari TaxID=2138241 RepID=A0AAF3J2L7_9BILA
MASIMRGYQAFLRPIVSAPKCKSATDTGNLFDIDGFLRTRDKEKQEFYRRFCSTQSFIRFIGRAIICFGQKKRVLTSGNYWKSTLPLSSNTVFIPPLEPLINVESGTERGFRYNGFPRTLDFNHFQMNKLNIEQTNDSKQQIPMVEKEIGRCAAVRTKHETRSSLMMAANGVRTQKIILAQDIAVLRLLSVVQCNCHPCLPFQRTNGRLYVWLFMVLSRLEATEVIPLDQVCYRILIEMCGQYGEPHLAVRVLYAMRRSGLEQNAVTYGLYHRAVMNVEWPSPSRVRAEQTGIA